MPTSGRNDATGSDTLNSWKEIANYLGRSVRAVQRWERELGLPVHRIRGTDGQTVYANRTEVDGWKRSRDLPKAESGNGDFSNGDSQHQDVSDIDSSEAHRAAPSTLKWIAATLGSVALLAAGFGLGMLYSATRVGPLAAVQAAGSSVVGYDPLGHILWTRNLGRQVSQASGITRSFDFGGDFIDLDQDGVAEVVVPLRFAEIGKPSPVSDALVAFNARGDIVWQFQPDRRLTCGSEIFTGPWRIYAVKVSSDTTHPRIWVAYNHSTWWPGFVSEIDADGQEHVKLLSTGWVWDITDWQTSAGSFLAVAGYSNDAERPMLTLIGSDAAEAMSPHTDRRFTCDGSPGGTPERAYLFPRLETGAGAPTFATMVQSVGERLKVGLRGGVGNAVIMVDSRLEVADFSFADSYWTAHRQLEVTGLLEHPTDACPSRHQGQALQEWSRAAGWHDTTIVPTARQSASGQEIAAQRLSPEAQK